MKTTENDSKFNFDELKWTIQIRETLNEELHEDSEFFVSIFNVPKPLMACDPDSYIPQQVAIGPYHFLRQELYEMERYKIAAAKRFQNQLQSLKLEHIVDQLIRLEHKIRACYHKYLCFNTETLIWMMVVDASFLLEFLHVYTLQDQTLILEGSSMMSSHFLGRKLAHNTILKDIVMLENQIPLFVLRNMLEFKFASLELADDMLHSMFIGLYKELSPFIVTEEDYLEIIVSECPHLLDFLYNMIVPKLEEEEEEQTDVVKIEDQHDNEKSFVRHIKKFLCEVCRFLSRLTTKVINLIKKVMQCRVMKFIIWLPWTIISNLPIVGSVKQPVEYLFFSREKESTKAENGNSSLDNNEINKSPLMDEISIPSVKELSQAGVCFMATKGGISTIKFDVKNVTLYLPTIGLDINTGVFMRNLVAYEASSVSGPLIFTRYTELVNGIIDTEEDARILREKGIILNQLKSDQEVADLWNGMTKSIKLTRVPFLDKVIEDVNQHYNSKLSIKIWKFMKVYVFASWQSLTFFAVVFLLFLTSLQVFCSFYRCSRRHRVRITG